MPPKRKIAEIGNKAGDADRELNSEGLRCTSVFTKGHPQLKTYKVDPYVVSDLIIKPLDSSGNLCMFYAMFNALRSTELRIAFSGCRLADPSYNFVECIKRLSIEHHERALDIGYNEQDMGFYLKWLRQNSHIKSHLWTRQKKCKTWRFTQIVDRNASHKEPLIWLL
jgi:hypothetical protein